MTHDEPRLRWTDVALVGVVWAVVALVEIADEPGRPHQIAHETITAATWALMSLPVLHLAIRYPVTRGRALLRVAGFLALGLAVALVQDVVTDVSREVVLRHRGPVLESLGRNLRRELFDLHEWELMVYGLVAGAGFLRGAHWRIRSQEAREGDLQRRLTEARLTALRMQLNPHFFFNTLNAISGFVHTDPDRATRVIARLGDLMRATLGQTGRQEITLSEELKLAHAYLDVVQARFGDRVGVEIDVEAGCEDALVPDLILQPLIENAVRHGMEDRKGEGRIEVRARRRGQSLVLEVADDGPGFPDGGVTEGVGLRTVRERLEQLYGKGHEWSVGNRSDGGARIRLALPYHEEDEVFVGV